MSKQHIQNLPFQRHLPISALVLFFFGVFFSGTAALSRPVDELRDRLPRWSVGAHQGGVFGPRMPNTLAQFEAAIKKGAQIVEMDLRISHDGISVVFHDETLKLWTHCKGKVSEKTWEELKNCRYRFLKGKMSSFEEILAWSNGKVIINAEFKDQETISPSLALVQKYQAHSWVYFQTQNNRNKYFLARALDQEVPLLYRIENEDDLKWVETLNDPALFVIEINQKMRSPSVIQRIHALGKLVSEDSFDFDRLKELFAAKCDKVFDLEIDIAITNRVTSCLKQSQNRD